MTGPSLLPTSKQQNPMNFPGHTGADVRWLACAELLRRSLELLKEQTLNSWIAARMFPTLKPCIPCFLL